MSPTSSSSPSPSLPRPKGVKAPHGASVFEIEWEDGTRHRLPHEILRGYCPCAGCQGHTPDIRFHGGRNQELRDLRAVGNYALTLVWGDGHDSGIFSFDYLYELGTLHDRLGTAGLIELEVLQRGRVVAAGSSD